MTKEEAAARTAIAAVEQTDGAFSDVLAATGFAMVPKEDARHLAVVRRKTGGTHSIAPGLWQVNAAGPWVSLSAGRDSDQPGMFSPGEAREIAMALIIFADQAERERR